MLPITLAFCAFVAFNNLSLQYNDVSFYQLMKILTTPAVVVLQLVLFKVQCRAATNVALDQATVSYRGQPNRRFK